jgi:hypothetical protein
VFIVGCFGDSGSAPAEILAISEGLFRDSQTSQSKGQETTEAAGTSVAGSLTANGIRCDLNRAVNGHLAVTEREREREVIGTITTTFGSKYSNHQEVMSGSLVVMDKPDSPNTARE